MWLGLFAGFVNVERAAVASSTSNAKTFALLGRSLIVV